MVVLATVLAIFVAVPIGVWAGVRKGKPADHIVNVTNFLLLAIPTFVIGTLLKEFVAIPINQAVGKTIFYTIGQQSPLAVRALSRPPSRLRSPHRPCR